MGLVIRIRGGKDKVKIGDSLINLVAMDGKAIYINIEAPKELQISRVEVDHKWKGKNKNNQFEYNENAEILNTESEKNQRSSESIQQTRKRLMKYSALSKSLSTTQSETLDVVGNTNSCEVSND